MTNLSLKTHFLIGLPFKTLTTPYTICPCGSDGYIDPPKKPMIILFVEDVIPGLQS